MDPKYSVLVNDNEDDSGICGKEKNSKGKNKGIHIAAIIVPIVVVTLAALIGLFAYFYPR